MRSERMTQEYNIEIYSTESDQEPFTDWLNSLRDANAKKSVLLRMQRIRQGNFGDCEPISGGLHELRIHLGPGFRVYFAKVGATIILLLGGGSKNSQVRDIEKCHAFLDDYKRTKK
jgi:putative addiction module killer protein